MKQYIDLHLHSDNSDGDYNVKHLVELVKESGIKYFSITDHDDMTSIREISEIDLENLIYYKGVEISALLDDKIRVHILGYDIDENNEKLKNIISQIQEKRKQRFLEIVRTVEEENAIKFKPEDIEKVVRENKVLGKAHLSRVMMKYGFGDEPMAIFQKYIHHISTTYPYRLDAKIVVDAIHDAGGYALIAHPKKIENEYAILLDEIMKNIIDAKLDGLEVYNSLHNYEDCQRYIKLCEEYNLLSSAGSDYHGPITKQKIGLGMLYRGNEEHLVERGEVKILCRKTK